MLAEDVGQEGSDCGEPGEDRVLVPLVDPGQQLARPRRQIAKRGRGAAKSSASAADVFSWRGARVVAGGVVAPCDDGDAAQADDGQSQHKRARPNENNDEANAEPVAAVGDHAGDAVDPAPRAEAAHAGGDEIWMEGVQVKREVRGVMGEPGGHRTFRVRCHTRKGPPHCTRSKVMDKHDPTDITPLAYIGVWLSRAESFETREAHMAFKPSADEVNSYIAERRRVTRCIMFISATAKYT